MRDHPLFQDLDWLDINMIEDWIEFFKKYLDIEYNHYLKSIVVDLTMYSFAKKQSSSLFDLTFDELFTLKFCTVDSLEKLADWLHLSMFDQETHFKYMLPVGFPSLKIMIENSSIAVFKDMIRSKVEFAQFHKLAADRYLRWVNLLSMIEAVEQHKDAPLMSRFRDKMLVLCADDSEEEFIEALHEWLRIEGILEPVDFTQNNLPVRKANFSEYDEKEFEYVEARIADIFDEDDFLTTWGITKFGLTLNSTQEVFTRIYRKYGKISHDEAVSELFILQTGYRIIDQMEAQVYPHTAQEAYLWGIAAMRSARNEYQEAPMIQNRMFTPLRQSTQSSILKKSDENNNRPKKSVTFKL
jgi:hypothetical protein